MSKIRYTVIVPVYNVEKILDRCIKSILNQTVEDFELILIDDGSTDKSGMICEEYRKMDTRIKVIHNENKGVSNARNTGLEIASGKYIVFVDSDDYVDKNYLQIFENNRMFDADLVVSGIKTHSVHGEVESESISNKECVTLDSENKIVGILKKWYAIQVYAKRFKKELIDKNKIRFDECFYYGEDSLFVAKYLLETKRIDVMDTATYNFCKYSTPTLSKINDEKWFFEYSKLQSELYTLFETYQEIPAYIMNKYLWSFELEISKIINREYSFLYKTKKLKKIMKLDFLQFCSKKTGSPNLNVFYRFCLDRKWAFPIIIIGTLRSFLYTLKSKRN